MRTSRGERPECPFCGAKTEAIGVYPHKPGEDAYTYKCTDCDRIIRRINDNRFGDPP